MTQKIVFATRLKARLKGLLFTDTFEGWLCFYPCKDIHTFGMRFAIDIAFVDERGIVVEIYRNVGRSRRVKCRRAVAAIERESTDEEFLNAGDFLEITVRRKEEK